MYFEWLSNINWIDILFVIIFIRMIYIGLKRKLVVEFFKSLGVLFAILFSSHYYMRTATFLSKNSALPLDPAIIVSYIILVLLAILLFRLILSGMLILFKIEPRGFLDRGGAVVLSIVRTVLTFAIISAFFVVSKINYLEFSTRQSFSGSRLVMVAPAIYKYSYINIISKFLPDEPLNYDIFDTIIKNKPREEEL